MVRNLVRKRHSLRTAGYVGSPVTARYFNVEVGAGRTGLMVGVMAGALVEEATVSWVIVETVIFTLTEVCGVDWK